MAEITCKQCGHVNEGERVYCHSCGAKLERVVVAEAAKPEIKREKERARIKKMTNPPSLVFTRESSNVALTLLWSLVAAALIEIARPPDHVPAPVSKDALMDAPQLNQIMEEAVEAPSRQPISLPEDVINAYLQNRIKPGDAGLAGTVTFDRAFVHLEDGVCRVVSQRSFEDYPLYGSVLYQLSASGTTLQSNCIGGYFGRLPIHPKIMNGLQVIYSDLWDKLKIEHKLLGQMASVEVHKTGIVLETLPPGK